MSNEIIKPIIFLEPKRFRLPIKFETTGLSIDVYGYDIEDAIKKFENNPSKYLQLPPESDSPSAYINQDAIIENGKIVLDMYEEDIINLIGFFKFNEENDPDFSNVSFFDCRNCLF